MIFMLGENMKINDLEFILENKDKYLLCATPEKGYQFNSLLFWGKNDSGYYADITKCQLYTYAQVMKRAGSGDIPIKVEDLIPTFSLHCEDGAAAVLTKAAMDFCSGDSL